VNITANTFWSESSPHTDPLMNFYRAGYLNIHNNNALVTSRDFTLLTGPAGTPSKYVSIRGNTVSGGRIRIPAELEQSEIVGNSFREGGEIVLYSTLANRDVNHVSIDGNVLGSPNVTASGRIDVTGTDQRVAVLSIRGNILYSQNRSTAWGPDSDPLIEVEMGADILATTLKSLHVENNVIHHNRTSTSVASALGISVVGKSTAPQEVAVVSNNALYGSDGISVSAFTSVNVSNNSLFRNKVNPTYSGSPQITVTNVAQTVVSGNMVEAGDDTGTPDPAGTASVIYVDGLSGSVRNNDVWGQNQGALNTVLSHSSEVTEATNLYHGLHSAQAGSTFTNGIVAF
jgi:hypothetical protein